MAANRHEDSGFTLIELLVVVVIMAVLAAVVVMAVNGITDRGGDAATKTDRQTVVKAEEAYLATQPNGAGKYATEAQLVPKFMASPSTLHDICMPPNHKSYAVIDAGDSCPSGMNLTP